MILDDYGAFNHVDGFVDVIEPIKFSSRAIPQPSGRGTVSTAEENLVARFRVPFEDPIGPNCGRAQGQVSNTKLNRLLGRHSSLRLLTNVMKLRSGSNVSGFRYSSVPMLRT